MFGNNQNPHGGPGNRGPSDDLQGGFASCAAAMVSIIVTPVFSEFTMPYVIWLAQDHYQTETVRFIAFAWDIIAWPMTFYAARAAIATALTVAGIILAYRMF